MTRLQHLVCDQRDLVLNALLDGQPVQVLEHRCHASSTSRLRERERSGCVAALGVGHLGAVEQRVAVVEPGADDAASDGVCHSSVQHKLKVH